MRTRPILAAAMMALAGSALGNPVIEGGARFTVLTPECIRMEFHPEGKFVDEPSMFAAVRPAVLPTPAVWRTSDGELMIDTGRLLLTYRADGEPFNDSNLSVRVGAGDREVIWTPSSRQTENLGGTIHTLDQVRGPVDLEEGVLSRDGWYLIDDSRTHLLVDGWAASRPEDAGTDWFFFGYGSDFAAAFHALTTAGGKVPMPRKVVLGSWYSRWWHYTTEDYKGIVREYEENDFPLDVIVMDMEWHTGNWTGWSWNYELLEDPPALLKWFGDQGLAVTLNVHPADGVIPTETMYGDFMKELGEDPTTSKTITYDAANRKYMEALFKHTHQPREDEGVDFWWLDWQQYPFTLGIPDLLNLRWLNYLYFQNSKRDGRRGLQFSRWGDWGDHRHPIHFSGDADTGWRMLGFEVPFTSTAGNEGCYFWSHDIGGHFGDRNEEVYTRWVQFAATTAAMRLHSGIIEYLDRRPWKWPVWGTDSMRRSFHLRSELMPYVYTSVWQTHRDSLPLNRPMYVAYPEQSDAYMAPQQYMLGEDVLVAPIAISGTGEGRVAHQLVWFPEGEWYDYFTSEKFTGPEWRVVSADINEWPMYVRAGAPLPAQPYTARPGTAPLGNLVVKVWPAADGAAVASALHEDDGETSEYENGRFATTRLSSARDGETLSLTVGATEGKYTGQLESRAITAVFHAVAKPGAVKVNGAKASGNWDDEAHTLTVAVPAASIRKETVITVEAAPEKNDYFGDRALRRRLRGIFGEDAPKTIAKALKMCASKPETTAAVLALAGVAFVENETHYPEVGLLRRVVRNSDSVVDAAGLTVTHRRTEVPSGEVIDETQDRFDSLSGAARLQNPELLDALIPFLSAARDERVLTARVGGMELSAATLLAERYGQLATWHISPPFAYDREKTIDQHVYTPETLDLKALEALATSDEWTVASPSATSVVDMREIHDLDEHVGYAVGIVETTEPSLTTLGFRSDDGIEVWLNGEKIHSVDAMRGINHPWENVEVTFREGKNILLLKITQGTNDWGFAVRGIPGSLGNE